jgi:hypothetical protein
MLDRFSLSLLTKLCASLFTVLGGGGFNSSPRPFINKLFFLPLIRSMSASSRFDNKFKRLNHLTGMQLVNYGVTVVTLLISRADPNVLLNEHRVLNQMNIGSFFFLKYARALRMFELRKNK